MARLMLLLMIAFLPGHGVCAGNELSRGNPGPLTAEAPAESYKIGRLFFSPDERAMLDQLRQKRGGSTFSATEQITLNGIVRRSSGKTTAWINQLPQNENENPQGVTVLKTSPKTSVTPLLLPSGKKVNLKAGQTLDITKGKVREGYEEAVSPSAEPDR
ncbi:hypothetical protein SCT_1287 [Sulfuricella sp. T08]|uniref:hypothetical protein n=1 Tax=Sulfuricella sp. T08 TaxID=1632857 RepID=UPI0006179D5B|nr:hypothetical protein [Sulfuricella sp. T08]GAO35891.1 hypothetical protein SCT_1287 [Sulfuricella sp. T08]